MRPVQLVRIDLAGTFHVPTNHHAINQAADQGQEAENQEYNSENPKNCYIMIHVH